jgi:hypothetical protein
VPTVIRASFWQAAPMLAIRLSGRHHLPVIPEKLLTSCFIELSRILPLSALRALISRRSIAEGPKRNRISTLRADNGQTGH